MRIEKAFDLSITSKSHENVLFQASSERLRADAFSVAEALLSDLLPFLFFTKVMLSLAQCSIIFSTFVIQKESHIWIPI